MPQTTASYSVRGPLLLGARLAGASEAAKGRRAHGVREVRFCVAFQLRETTSSAVFRGRGPRWENRPGANLSLGGKRTARASTPWGLGLPRRPSCSLEVPRSAPATHPLSNYLLAYAAFRPDILAPPPPPPPSVVLRPFRSSMIESKRPRWSRVVVPRPLDAATLHKRFPAGLRRHITCSLGPLAPPLPLIIVRLNGAAAGTRCGKGDPLLGEHAVVRRRTGDRGRDRRGRPAPPPRGRPALSNCQAALACRGLGDRGPGRTDEKTTLPAPPPAAPLRAPLPRPSGRGDRVPGCRRTSVEVRGPLAAPGAGPRFWGSCNRWAVCGSCAPPSTPRGPGYERANPRRREMA